MDKIQILVAEDESIVARDIQKTLQNLGYEVPFIVSSGEAVIQKAEESKPDLVLMDIVLKGEIDGIEAAAQIRSRFNIPVVYLTAYTDDKMIQRAKITEPFGYIVKPFEDREVRTIIEMAIYRAGMEKELRRINDFNHSILKTLPFGMDIVDEEGNILYLSEKLESVFGKEAIGKKCWSIYKDNQKQCDNCPLKKEIEIGEVKSVDVEGVCGGKIFQIAHIAMTYQGKKAILEIFNDITERKKVEETLRQTVAYLENLFNYANAPIIVWDSKLMVSRFNHAFEYLTGYSGNDVVGKKLSMLFPEATQKESLNKIERTLTGEYWKSVEIPILCKNGDVKLALWNSANIYAEDRKTLIATIAQGVDITERKQAEKRIKAALKEKEMLLREIHHRVKNNMQIISSLLNLQAKYIGDKRVSILLRESHDRIKTMALIHERLYQSGDIARVDFADYIRNLTGQMFSSYGISSEAVKLDINIKDFFPDINTAVPCGLIIHELVSNSLKYAFPDGRGGKIAIKLYSDKDNKLTLIIRDNGIGFPVSLEFRNTDSLGLQLVNTLVRQLDGRIELDRSDGTAFRIEFEEAKEKRQ